jgi:hypothetical protein
MDWPVASQHVDSIELGRMRRNTGFFSALVALSLVCACSRRHPVEPPSGNDSEPSFTQQAQAVREGQSTQIRLDRTLVTDGDLRQLEGLEDKLLRINLSRSEITDAGLLSISRMKRLEQLRLASPQVDDAGLECLTNLKHLRFLHLIDMPITDAGLDHLHVLTGLESLYLDGTRTTDEGIGRLLAALPGVHLHVDDHHHRLDSHKDDHKHARER